MSIREIEHPEQSQFIRSNVFVKPPLAELRLTFGMEIQVSAIVLQDIEQVHDLFK